MDEHSARVSPGKPGQDKSGVLIASRSCIAPVDTTPTNVARKREARRSLSAAKTGQFSRLMLEPIPKPSAAGRRHSISEPQKDFTIVPPFIEPLLPGSKRASAKLMAYAEPRASILIGFASPGASSGGQVFEGYLKTLAGVRRLAPASFAVADYLEKSGRL